MVDWQPISGVVPPITESEWLDEFKRYKQYPEFKFINQDMNLNEFKRIFWVEYLHRVVGRIVAIVFFVPFIYFLVRGYLTRPFAIRLMVVFALGGLQGLLGWYMVQSGLVNNPAVSQYRLTAHLGLAVVLYSYVLWLALSLIRNTYPVEERQAVHVWRGAILAIAIVVLMQVSGGFMAGTHAGFVINTFPDMNGELLPEMMFAMQPVWKNLSENTVTIQFFHRWVAVLALLCIGGLWVLRWRLINRSLKKILDLVALVALLQFSLGVTTLLTRVELSVALAHQSGFVLLLTLLIIALWYAWQSVPANVVAGRSTIAIKSGA